MPEPKEPRIKEEEFQENSQKELPINEKIKRLTKAMEKHFDDKSNNLSAKLLENLLKKVKRALEIKGEKNEEEE